MTVSSDRFGFRKSSRCEALKQDGCVAAGRAGRTIGIQDTVSGRHLEVSQDAWRRTADRIKAGGYDTP